MQHGWLVRFSSQRVGYREIFFLSPQMVDFTSVIWRKHCTAVQMCTSVLMLPFPHSISERNTTNECFTSLMSQFYYFNWSNFFIVCMYVTVINCWSGLKGTAWGCQQKQVNCKKQRWISEVPDQKMSQLCWAWRSCPWKSGSGTRGDLSQETWYLVSVQWHLLLSPGTLQSAVRYS